MALAREAATVVLAARTRQELAAAAAAIRESGGTALAIPTDVTQDAAVEAMVEQANAETRTRRYPGHAAGAASSSGGGTSRRLGRHLAVNLRAVMNVLSRVLPAMIRQHRGTIINIASVAARGPSRRRRLHGDEGRRGRLQRVLAEELRATAWRRSPRARAVDTPLWDTIGNPPDRSRMLRPGRCAGGGLWPRSHRAPRSRS